MLNHFAQYWGILLHIHLLGSRYFWITASIWYILADWVLDNFDNFGQLRRFWLTFTNSVQAIFVQLYSFWTILADCVFTILVDFGQLCSF